MSNVEARLTKRSEFVIRSSSLGQWRLALLGAVQAARLLTALNAERVERAADDVVTHARQVANTAAAHEHDRVFLQVVAFARNVHGHFLAVAQAHAGDLSQSRVRLLRGH